MDHDGRLEQTLDQAQKKEQKDTCIDMSEKRLQSYKDYQDIYGLWSLRAARIHIRWTLAPTYNMTLGACVEDGLHWRLKEKAVQRLRAV